MITRDDLPATPDWHSEGRDYPDAIVLPAAQFDRLMSELDEPPRISTPLRRLVLAHRERVLPPTIELGEN